MGVESFDYVVVGGGSAGCVVASRLSEDPASSVALVEAGPPDIDEVFRVPGRFSELQKSWFDWDLSTEPEPALAGRRAYLPRGRVLGGTSSINTMLYVRGSAADYDEWAAQGCDGWSFEEVLPLFRRSEDNERGADHYHGVGRPAGRRRRGVGAVAAASAGSPPASRPAIPPTRTSTARPRSGSGSTRRPNADGVRCSASSAFLDAARVRANLNDPDLDPGAPDRLVRGPGGGGRGRAPRRRRGG